MTRPTRYLVKMTSNGRFTAVFVMAKSAEEACAAALRDAPQYDRAQAKVA